MLQRWPWNDTIPSTTLGITIAFGGAVVLELGRGFLRSIFKIVSATSGEGNQEVTYLSSQSEIMLLPNYSVLYSTERCP